MRRISIDEAREGMRLARTLYYETGVPMLKAGAALDLAVLSKLRAFGYSSIYVYDDGEQAGIQVSDYIDDTTRIKVTQNVRALYSDIKTEVARQFKPEELRTTSQKDIHKKLRSKEFERIVDHAKIRDAFLKDIESVIDNTLENPDLSECVGALKTQQSFMFDHSVEVAIHSCIIARKANLTRSEIREVVIGCLIHDVGYMFVPEDVMKKRRHTDAEKELLKMHTVYGYSLVREWREISLLSAHVAYQHHERHDGTGYPRGLKGSDQPLSRRASFGEDKKIHRYSEIVAVANAYDALISDAPFRRAIPPDQAVKTIFMLRGTAYNPEVVDIFLSYMPVFPLGTEVLVLDGRFQGYHGNVIKISRDKLDKPVMRLVKDKFGRKLAKPIEVDLSEDKMDIRAVWN